MTPQEQQAVEQLEAALDKGFSGLETPTGPRRPRSIEELRAVGAFLQRLAPAEAPELRARLLEVRAVIDQSLRRRYHGGVLAPLFSAATAVSIAALWLVAPLLGFELPWWLGLYGGLYLLSLPTFFIAARIPGYLIHPSAFDPALPWYKKLLGVVERGHLLWLAPDVLVSIFSEGCAAALTVGLFVLLVWLPLCYTLLFPLVVLCLLLRYRLWHRLRQGSLAALRRQILGGAV